MKLTKAVLAFGLVLFCSKPAFAAITMVQQKASNGGSACSNPCTVSGLAATTAGNLIVIAVQFAGGPGTITSSSNEPTTPGGHSCTFGSGGGDMSYSLSAVGGKTSIAVTVSANMYSVIITEYKNTGHKWILDGGAARNNATTVGTIGSSPVYTTHLSGGLAIVAATPSSGFTAGAAVTGAGWTTPIVTENGGQGYDHALNTAAGFNTIAGLTDNSSGDSYCSTLLAFGPPPVTGFPIIQ